jgi:hypothetical protein
MATVSRWDWLAKLRKRRNAAAIGRAEAIANETDAERATASIDITGVAADEQAARMAGQTPSEADRLGE